MERFGWNHHVHVSFFSPPSSLELPPFSCLPCLAAVVGCGSTAPRSTVVPWAFAVVPRGRAIVRQVPTVVPRSPSGSNALYSQAVVPPLGSTTVSSFCYFRFFVEVGTEVPLPPGRDFCLTVVPHWGLGSTARAEVPPPALRLCLCWVRGTIVGRYDSTALLCGSTAWLQEVVPRGLAVVLLARRGSTVGRGLVGG